MRGSSMFPGLVHGEACFVTIHGLPPGSDYTGPAVPSELFDRPWSGSVDRRGTRRQDGRYEVTVRLSDYAFESRPHFRPFYGKEPPAPFPYDVSPVHFLNGWTHEGNIHVGDPCFIWIRPHGGIPWVEEPNPSLPSAFPGYPRTSLVGFWEARLMTVLKSREPTRVRKVRAIFTDIRLQNHRDSRMRDLFGHEPWIDYLVTSSDNDWLEAGAAMLRTATDPSWTRDAINQMWKVPDRLRAASRSLWTPDDFHDTP